MTPAGRLQSHLKRQVKAQGGWCRKLKWESRRGAPDWLVSFGFPRVALVEVKAGNDVLSPLQLREIDRLRADGWAVYVVKNERDIDRMIEEIRNG